MKRWLLPAVLLLAACQPQEIDPAYDEARGAELMEQIAERAFAGVRRHAAVRALALQRHTELRAQRHAARHVTVQHDGVAEEP